MESERPSFYAVLDAEVRYDKRLSSTAKIIYAELTALSKKDGFAWASNKYFAENFDISPSQVSRIMSQLSEIGYIKVFVAGNYMRKIILCKTVKGTQKAQTPTQKAQGGYAKSANPPTQKAQKNNTRLIVRSNKGVNEKDFIDTINRTFNKKIRVLPKGYKETLKTFTLEEIQQAYNNIIESVWYKNLDGSIRTSYIVRPSTVDEWRDEQPVKESINDRLAREYANRK